MKTAVQAICLTIISAIWLACSSTAEGTAVPEPASGQYKIGVVHVTRVFDAPDIQKDSSALLQSPLVKN